MLLVVEIVGILCMLTLIFVSIWGFILEKQFYSQMRYQNYLLEKLTHNIYILAKKNNQLPIPLEKTEVDLKNPTSSNADYIKENLDLNTYTELNTDNIDTLSNSK